MALSCSAWGPGYPKGWECRNGSGYCHSPSPPGPGSRLASRAPPGVRVRCMPRPPWPRNAAKGEEHPGRRRRRRFAASGPSATRAPDRAPVRPRQGPTSQATSAPDLRGPGRLRRRPETVGRAATCERNERRGLPRPAPVSGAGGGNGELQHSASEPPHRRAYAPDGQSLVHYLGLRAPVYDLLPVNCKRTQVIPIKMVHVTKPGNVECFISIVNEEVL